MIYGIRYQHTFILSICINHMLPKMNLSHNMSNSFNFDPQLLNCIKMGCQSYLTGLSQDVENLISVAHFVDQMKQPKFDASLQLSCLTIYSQKDFPS